MSFCAISYTVKNHEVLPYTPKEQVDSKRCFCFFSECQLRLIFNSHIKKFYCLTLKHRAERTSEDSTLGFFFSPQSFGTRTLNNGFGWVPKLIVPTSIELSPQTFSGNFPSFISHNNAESIWVPAVLDPRWKMTASPRKVWSRNPGFWPTSNIDFSKV